MSRAAETTVVRRRRTVWWVGLLVGWLSGAALGVEPEPVVLNWLSQDWVEHPPGFSLAFSQQMKHSTRWRILNAAGQTVGELESRGGVPVVLLRWLGSGPHRPLSLAQLADRSATVAAAVKYARATRADFAGSEVHVRQVSVDDDTPEAGVEVELVIAPTEAIVLSGQVKIDPRDGRVYGLRKSPSGVLRLPLDPQLTAPQALEVARRHLLDQDFELTGSAGDPILDFFADGPLSWSTAFGVRGRLGSAPSPEHIRTVSIDASSGAVLVPFHGEDQSFLATESGDTHASTTVVADAAGP